MEHTCRRIEPPVILMQPKIISDNEKFLVIDKPPFLIVHTGGGYLYNTLMGHLKYRVDYKEDV